jgi:hypothetical protein
MAMAQSAQQTPEQREAAQLKAQLAAYETEKQARTEMEAKAKANAAADAAWAQLEPEFLAAIKAHPELPLTRGTMKKLAGLGEKFLAAGVDLTPAQVVAELARTEGETFHGRIRSAPAEVAYVWLTPAQRDYVARKRSEEIRAKRNPAQAQAPSEPARSQSSAQSGGGLTTRELLEQLPRKR